MEPTRPRLTLPLKLSYSLGWPVEGIVLLSFEIFVLFYYTQVIGLSGTLTGIALFIALAVDGFADPLIGSFSDGLRNARWGHRHTLMILSALPLGIAFALVFVPPAGMGQWGIFGWLTATAIVTRAAAGFFIIPYSALNAELTREAAGRASLGVYKSIAQTGFILLLVTSAFQYFFAATPSYAHGQSDPAAYPPFALTWAAILILVILLCCAGTYRFARRIERFEPPLAPAERPSLARFVEGWRSALVINRNVRWIILGSIALTITSGMVRTLTSHMSIYFWQLSPPQIALQQQAAIPGMLIGLFIARASLKRAETLSLLMIGMALSYLGYGIMPALRLAALLPANGTRQVFDLLLFSSMISGVGLGILSLMSGLICAEASDEDELIYGRPQQGMLFGFIFLATKVGSACGKLAAGVALDLVHFPVGKTLSTVGPRPIHQLGVCLVLVLVVLGGLSFLFWSRFSLRKDRHADIVARLAEARQSATIEVPEPGVPQRALAPSGAA